jgi:hypothetical protein
MTRTRCHWSQISRPMRTFEVQVEYRGVDLEWTTTVVAVDEMHACERAERFEARHDEVRNLGDYFARRVREVVYDDVPASPITFAPRTLAEAAAALANC